MTSRMVSASALPANTATSDPTSNRRRIGSLRETSCVVQLGCRSAAPFQRRNSRVFYESGPDHRTCGVLERSRRLQRGPRSRRVSRPFFGDLGARLLLVRRDTQELSVMFSKSLAV